MAKLREPVIFRTKRHNLTIEIKGGASQLRDPNAALHSDVKQAQFRDGVYQTDDPEIADFLDARAAARGDVWRADDPASDLKAELGPKGYEKMRKRMAQVEAAEFAAGNKPSE